MLTITTLSNATLDELNTELAAAGHPSDHRDIHEARLAAGHLIAEVRKPDLCDSETGDALRLATAEEIVDSALAGAEGHIEAEGRTCYVEA